MRVAIAIILAVVCMTTAALADRRVALVVGNFHYQYVPRLKNAQNDGRAVAELLRGEDFDVEEYQNLGNDDLRRVVRTFVSKSRDADVAVVYFAGHGIEVDGANYLIPVDARLKTDLSVHDEALSLERVLQVLEPARRLRLVILDACRDNPFLKTMSRTVATRAVARGLAQVEPSKPNTLIAFAAKAGSVADDGVGEHSPFTEALLRHVAEPGLDIRLALGRVRDEVLEKTRNGQEPFVYGSLGGAVITLSAKTSLPIDAKVADTSSDEARKDFAVAQKLGSLDGWDAFLSRYKQGYVADLGRKERERLAARNDRLPASGSAAGHDQTPRIGGSFGLDDRERVARIAARNQITLPSYEISPTDSEVVPGLRRFVGVWASKVGYGNGLGRHAIIITTSVTTDGLLQGFLAGGPPTRDSVIQRPAFTTPFVARIEGSSFSFRDGVRHNVEMSKDGRLKMKDETQQGTFLIELEPVWIAADPAKTTDVAAVPTDDNLPEGNAGTNTPFDKQARARVSAIAFRNKLPLPEFSLNQSSRKTPDHLKKFIGVWASTVGFNGGPVQAMMIVTDVSETGKAEGRYLLGATPPGSPQSRPARNLPLQGPITGLRLSFTTPRAAVDAILSADNSFQMTVVETTGRVSKIELSPVWTLLAGLHSPSKVPAPAPSSAQKGAKRAAPTAASIKPTNADAENPGRGGGRRGGGGSGGDIFDNPRFGMCSRMASQRGMTGPGSGRRQFIRSCVSSG